MDYAPIHHQFEALIADGQLEEAIELIVDVAERPDLHQEISFSAINSLVYSALIPEQRFIESIAWLDDSIQGDYGYESWNSVSNLGNVYLRLGQVERAKSLFETLLQAQTGPIDEATEFLNLIEAGEAESIDAKIPDPRTQDTYKQLLAHMEKDPADSELLEAFAISRGGATYGFVQGLLASEGIQKLNPSYDVVAQVLWDYLTKEPASTGPTYEESVAAVAAGSATKEHVRIVRSGAFDGTPGAASAMYTYVSQKGGYAWPWRNVSVARGEQVIQETLPTEVSSPQPPKPRSNIRL